MLTLPLDVCTWFCFDNFSYKIADMQTLPGWSRLPLLQFAQVVELVILELVFTIFFCTFRFTSADYIGPVDSRGMVIDKEVSVKIWKKKIMTIILIPTIPKTSVTIALELHQKLCFQVYRQVFRNAKLAKREGVSVGHFVDKSAKVYF